MVSKAARKQTQPGLDDEPQAYHLRAFQFDAQLHVPRASHRHLGHRRQGRRVADASGSDRNLRHGELGAYSIRSSSVCSTTPMSAESGDGSEVTIVARPGSAHRRQHRQAAGAVAPWIGLCRRVRPLAARAAGSAMSKWSAAACSLATQHMILCRASQTFRHKRLSFAWQVLEEGHEHNIPSISRASLE
jgi:hypothetical protein